MDFEKIPLPDQVGKLLDDSNMMERIPELAEAMQNKRGSRDYFPVGFDLFNKVMDGGITDGDLVVISGPSGHGKTTFAQTMTYHLSQIGIPVAWFSYEIPIDELWKKFMDMGIDPKLFNGYAPKKLASGNVKWIKDRIMETILKHQTKIIFLDHLGFLTPEIDESNSKDFERNYSAYLGQLTRQLKGIAIQHEVTVVLLVHTRKTNKDELSLDSVAHSIGIVQEADFVFMVERIREKSKKSWLSDSSASEGEVFTPFSKVSMVKNRRTGQNKFIKAEFKHGRLQEVKLMVGSPEQNEIVI